MAKATITIEDLERDGEVHVSLVFDPPIRKGEDGTCAQNAAFRALRLLRAEAEETIEELDA